jgi:hypothetical protein
MSEGFHGLPAAMLLAVWTALVGASGWFGRRLFRWMRGISAREWDEVVALRRIVDRIRRRENAYATGCELLLIVMPEELTPAQRQGVKRARELFETATLPWDGEP